MSFLLFFCFQNQNFYLYLIIISFKVVAPDHVVLDPEGELELLQPALLIAPDDVPQERVGLLSAYSIDGWPACIYAVDPTEVAREEAIKPPVSARNVEHVP